MQDHDGIKSCSICKHLPEYQKVELLHGTELLPAEVGRLRIVGGAGIYGADQIRVCQECGTYYRFIHDHDSEAGMGEGYTDEMIGRLTVGQALEALREIERGLHASIAWWAGEVAKGSGAHAERFLAEKKMELEQVSAEIVKLSL
ncbi:hypothetical protein KBA41_04675 [Candidatus Ozemobacteraceae bacterium]|nr:hypothetical protein [Candidatus Ozemobacteraceae bacterium]OQA08053.1 MAG: hypothetical protein BWY66_01159 [bacterium ADurb.Bin374]